MHKFYFIVRAIANTNLVSFVNEFGRLEDHFVLTSRFIKRAVIPRAIRGSSMIQEGAYQQKAVVALQELIIARNGLGADSVGAKNLHAINQPFHTEVGFLFKLGVFDHREELLKSI